MINIKDNLAKVVQQINIACQAAERSSAEVQLLAVSKTKPSNMIELAYQAGQYQFGENYVQEAVDKIAELSHLPNICWHFIGPIQSNKTKLIANNFAWVHSVDRLKIAERLNEQRSAELTPLNVCLQVNISDELTKSGVSVEELPALAAFVNEAPHLTLRGLMAIPEKNGDGNSFFKMQSLFVQYQAQYPSIDTLSMGMSDDLTQAIAAGSTMVRIGSAIFGAR